MFLFLCREEKKKKAREIGDRNESHDSTTCTAKMPAVPGTTLQDPSAVSCLVPRPRPNAVWVAEETEIIAGVPWTFPPVQCSGRDFSKEQRKADGSRETTDFPKSTS